ncbi:MAG: hypothetical protein QNK25_08860, partial [Desulfobacterales bacterium]|nr:hypothetical protein [Desulfobacterales bacterium]
ITISLDWAGSIINPCGQKNFGKRTSRNDQTLDVIRDVIGVVRKTFRLRTVFLLQTLMPRSYFRNIIMTSGIKSLGHPGA